MGNLNGRLKRLEQYMGEPGENKEAKELWRRLFATTMNEPERLTCWRVGHVHPHGTPPRDFVGEKIGYPYTTAEMIDVAIEQVWDQEGFPEDWMEEWKEAFRAFVLRAGSNLEKVEAYGAPDAPPTRRQGFWHGA